MQNREFDLDVTFDEGDPDLSSYSEQSIRAEIVNNQHVAIAIAKRPLVGELG